MGISFKATYGGLATVSPWIFDILCEILLHAAPELWILCQIWPPACKSISHLVSVCRRSVFLPHSVCPLIAPQIDFVAHDDIPYSSAGSEDVYKHIKEAGERDMKKIGTSPRVFRRNISRLNFSCVPFMSVCCQGCLCLHSGQRASRHPTSSPESSETTTSTPGATSSVAIQPKSSTSATSTWEGFYQ